MGLTNQTAVDFGPEGIRINAICPGFMVHPQNDDALRDDEEMQEYFREQYPVGRCEPTGYLVWCSGLRLKQGSC